MLFSELYSAYYNTVAAIISAAFSPDVSEKELMGYIREEAFSESVLTILPSLKSGKWPLLNDDLTPKLSNAPSMPLTNLQKKWLKAISLDPRVKLFGVDFPELSDTEPYLQVRITEYTTGTQTVTRSRMRDTLSTSG